MRRLQRLGNPLRPSLEVADAVIDAAKLDPLMDARPPLKIPTQAMLNPRSVTLDRERYTLEIDAGARRWLYEWVGVNMDWTPAAVDDIAIARWAGELRDCLDALLGSDDISKHAPNNVNWFPRARMRTPSVAFYSADRQETLADAGLRFRRFA